MWECYTITAPAVTKTVFLTTRNFGQDLVIVKKPSLMCEPALKTPIDNFPPFEDTAPSDASE